MNKTMFKRVLAIALTLCMVLSMCPVTALAADYSVGDTVSNTTGEKPEDVAGAIWAESTSTETICGNLYEHTHDEDCYSKSCDHKNGHLSSCYSTATSYALCEHEDESAHTGTVTLADVVTIIGKTVTWKTDHPAYPAVYAVYKAAYDEAYANAPLLKDTAGKAAGVAALTDKKFCYTTAASATPDLCTHTCSEVGGSCYTKICLLSEHTHTADCYETTYTWTLYADVNGNEVADVNETYTVTYVNGDEVLYTESGLAYGAETPAIAEPTGAEGYVFAGWTPEVAATVTAPAEGTTITYTATWKPDVDENNDGTPDGQQSCTITVTGENVIATINDSEVATATVKAGSADNKVTVAPAEGYYITGVTLNGEAAEYTATGATVEIDAGYSETYTIAVETAAKQNTEVIIKENVTVDYFGEAIAAEDVLAVALDYVAAGETKVTDSAEDVEVVVTDVTLGDMILYSYSFSKWSNTTNGWIPAGTSIGGDNVPLGELMDTYKITVYYPGNDMYNASQQVDIEFELVEGRAESSLVLEDATIQITDLSNATITADAIKDALYVSSVGDGELAISYIAKYNEEYDTYVMVYSGALGIGSTDLTEFGKYEVRMKLGETSAYQEAEATAYLTIVDGRVATEITLNEGVTFTYSETLTEENVLNAVFASLTAGEEKLDKEVTMTIDSLNAGTHTVTVKFAGDNTYAASSAQVEITINKAASTITINSANVKYDANNPVNASALIDSGAADRIEFVVGLSLGENAGTDAGTVAYVNLPAIVDLDSINNEMVKAAVQKALSNLASGNSMTVTELKNALETTLSALEALEGNDLGDYFSISLSTEAISVLVSALDTIEGMDGVGDLTVYVTMDQDVLLSNAGAYIVGGVVADANYETAYGMNYVVITPDGAKLELGWNENDTNGIYTLEALKENKHDLGAHIETAYEVIDGADPADRLEVVFIGADVDNGAAIITDASQLTIGTYTEIAYIRDLGNQMYYAEPLVRQVTVISDLVTVEFVDANSNNARVFQKDGTPHAMEAVATHRDGIALDQNNLTYRIYGVESDGDLYEATFTHAEIISGSCGPVNTGIYTVVATYREDYEGGDPARIGVAVGALIIRANAATITVKDEIRPYEAGKTTALSSLITSSPEDAKRVVIVAGVSDIGDFSEQGLAAVQGQVLVDFPDRVDEAINALTNQVYFNNEQFNVLLTSVAAALKAAGVDTGSVKEIFDQLAALPGDVEIKITDLSGYTFEHVGVWAVVGGIMDNDYYPAVDTGLVVIHPETTEYTLTWNYNDANGIITRPVLNEIDLLATAKNAEGEMYEGEVKYFVYGVDDEGNEVKFSGTEEDIAEQIKSLPNGIYTQVAYIETKLDANMSVAAPIMRQLILTPQNVTVDAPNETYTYGDEIDYAERITVTKLDETPITGDELAAGLTVKYVGINTEGSYYSTDVPGNAGTYAVYAEYKIEENGELKYFGVDMGTLTIEPARLGYDVEDSFHRYVAGQTHEPVITNPKGASDILFIVDVENKTVNVVAPTLGVDQDPNYNWDGDIHIQYWLKQLDAALAQLKDATGADAVAALENLLAVLPEEIINSDTYGDIMGILTDIDSDKLTLNGPLPSEVGRYNVYAIAYKNPNYVIEISEGTMTISDGIPVVFNPNTDETGTIVPGNPVYINDEAYILDDDCVIWLEEAPTTNIAVTYSYKIGDFSFEDAPTGMYVWQITEAETVGCGSQYNAAEVKALRNILVVRGGSVWLNSKGDNGIGYYYQYNGDNAAAEEALIALGYKPGEHGTVIDWATAEGNPQLRDGNHAAGHFDENTGWCYDKVYPLSDKYIVPAMNVRFYLKLTSTTGGEDIVLYSGTFQRSIGYIAYQNTEDYDGEATYAVGSEFYNYVWNIVNKAAKNGVTYGN